LTQQGLTEPRKLFGFQRARIRFSAEVKFGVSRKSSIHSDNPPTLENFRSLKWESSLRQLAPKSIGTQPATSQTQFGRNRPGETDSVFKEQVKQP